MTEPVPTFQPGKFKPVIELGVRPIREPISLNADFEGLERLAMDSLRMGATRARGAGAMLDFDPRGFDGDAKVIHHFLAARNLAEQIRTTETLHTRMTTPLVNARVDLVEPIAKAYSYYGHFEIDDHVYAQSDARREMAEHLIRLAHYATATRTTTQDRNNSAANLGHIDFDYFTVGSDGELTVTHAMPLDQKIITVISAITAEVTMTATDKKLLIREATKLTTSRGYLAFVARISATYPGLVINTPNNAAPAGDNMRNAIRTLFSNANLTVGNGDIIPARDVNHVIARATQVLERIATQYHRGIKLSRLAKYEGGARVQLAQIQDTILYSEVTLTPADVTAAHVLELSTNNVHSYSVATGDTPQNVRLQVVMDSLI